jgi:hypothetical protein
MEGESISGIAVRPFGCSDPLGFEELWKNLKSQDIFFLKETCALCPALLHTVSAAGA